MVGPGFGLELWRCLIRDNNARDPLAKQALRSTWQSEILEYIHEYAYVSLIIRLAVGTKHMNSSAQWSRLSRRVLFSRV